MGYKFFLGAGLLAAMLLGCLLVGRSFDRKIAPMTRHLENALLQAEAGQMEQAEKDLEKIKSLWETHRGIFASLSNHNPMDDIDELIAEAENYAKNGCREDFLTAGAKLRQELESLTLDHRLTWWNFLSYFSLPPLID